MIGWLGVFNLGIKKSLFGFPSKYKEPEIEIIQKLRKNRQQLNQKLMECREVVAKKQEAFDKKQKAYEELKHLIAEMRSENTKMRQKLAFYEGRLYGREIDPTLHNTTESMDSFFSSLSEEGKYREFGESFRDVLEKKRILFQDLRVLDFGVGPGIVLAELLANQKPAEIVGYDTSEVGLSHAKKVIPSGRFEKGDIYSGTEEQFDVVLCTEVLEHLRYPAKALHTLYRMTAPGGLMLVAVPDGRIDYSRFHINFWSAESWRYFLEDNLPEGDFETCQFQPYSDRTYFTNLAIVQKPGPEKELKKRSCERTVANESKTARVC